MLLAKTTAKQSEHEGFASKPSSNDRGPTSAAPQETQSSAQKTTWLERPLRISISYHTPIELIEQGYDPQFDRVFPIEVNAVELAAHLMCGDGYSIQCNKMHHEKHFAASDVLTVEINGTFSLDEALAQPFVDRHATLIYTIYGHSDANPRFRIAFVLARTIHSLDEFRAATRALQLRISGEFDDVNAASTYFSEGDDNVVYREAGIPDDILDSLIKQGWGANQTDTGSGQRKASTKSLTLLDKDQRVRRLTGDDIALAELSRSDSIYCPVHNDKIGTAHVIVNHRSERGVHCRVCEQSFWTRPDVAPYDFYTFEKVARAVQLNGVFAPAALDEFCTQPPDSLQQISEARIMFQNALHLEKFELAAGATFIKSPKGSGKTDFLTKLAAKHPGSRILLVGHRRSLIKDMCFKLKLDCYLADDGRTLTGNQNRYGICLDSLLKVRTDRPYDFVFIDESEQVLAHFLSDTMKEKRIPILRRLQHIIKQAKHIVALDADLSWNSFLRICDWRRGTDQIGSNTVVINTFQKSKGKLHLVASKEQLLGEVQDAVQHGKRVFFTSNSRAVVERVDKVLGEKFPSIPRIALTSSTVGDEDPRYRAFLKEPKHESTKYQVVLASPTLGTGVDFTFEFEQDRFDVVFGFFQPLVLSHFDCDQQIARVRSPKEVRVFVHPQKYTFETDIDTVTDDLLSFEMMGHLIKGYNQIGAIQYEKLAYDDPLLRIAASVLSVERASKNNLKDAFTDYALRQGWEVVVDEPNSAKIGVGKEIWFTGEGLRRKEIISRLVEAKPLGEEAFREMSKQIDHDDLLTEAQRASYFRTSMERFYCTQISVPLITFDDDGRSRDRVRLFELMIDQRRLDWRRKLAEESMLGEKRASDVLESGVHKEFMLILVLERTPFYASGVFNASAECTAEDLQEFTSFLRQNRVSYETQFGWPLRADLESKPMSQLRDVLSAVGLGIVKTRTSTKNGIKRYFYKLEPMNLAEMQNIAARRRQPA